MKKRQCNIYSFSLSPTLSEYTFFDIGSSKPYLRHIQVPFTQTDLCRYLQKKSDRKATCYFSGDYLARLAEQKGEVSKLKQLIQSGQLEILLGTYHHSISCLLSSQLFRKEVNDHRIILTNLLDVKPAGFYNPLAIYSNDLLDQLAAQQISYTFAPTIDWYLKSDGQVKASIQKGIDLILLGSSSNDKKFIIRHLSSDSKEQSLVASSLAGEMVSSVDTKDIYSLPSVSGVDEHGENLDYYFGNTLQKQALRSMKTLAEDVAIGKNFEHQTQLLQLATPAIFAALHETNHNRVTAYTRLMNMLADLETRM